ncbi:MAG: VWA domain-containing protein [Bryobacteraceae bacterium]
MSHLLANLVRFGRMLHDAGMDVQAGRMTEVAHALGFIDIGRRQEFYHALRTLLVHRVEDLPLFDAAFRVFWRAPRGERTMLDLQSLGEERRFGEPEIEPQSLGARDDVAIEAAAPAERVEVRTYSAREVLREKDFAKLTPEELAQAEAMMAELRWEPGVRRSRRWQPSRVGVADLRRALRSEMRNPHGVAAMPRRASKWKRRPIVLLCDVSGSMERYSRMLLQFAHCMTGGFERVEAFVFATRLTRITLALRTGRARRALAAAQEMAPDWSGGTRIGDALHSFHVDWARRAMSYGPVVLLISDGWDRGDPALLGREMARLRRSCHRLIWLNPLLGSPRYEPLTRGIRAALPYVDDFLPVHNMASLESLARHLNDLPARGPRRGGRMLG